MRQRYQYWIEEHLSDYYGGMGRPPKSRTAIARAFIAKIVYNMPTTRLLLERQQSDKSLRHFCGWGGPVSHPT